MFSNHLRDALRHPVPCPTCSQDPDVVRARAAKEALPQPGEVWDQKPTAAMRRDHTTRTVRVESVDSRWVYVSPVEGKGRRTRVEIPGFLRKFTRRTT